MRSSDGPVVSPGQCWISRGDDLDAPGIFPSGVRAVAGFCDRRSSIPCHSSANNRAKADLAILALTRHNEFSRLLTAKRLLQEAVGSRRIDEIEKMKPRFAAILIFFGFLCPAFASLDGKTVFNIRDFGATGQRGIHQLLVLDPFFAQFVSVIARQHRQHAQYRRAILYWRFAWRSFTS